ncbi:MAG TPA: GSU2403 family nucleotidyltransferase fold protein [Longimicrobium sp.]|jgi:hypothetical protein
MSEVDSFARLVDALRPWLRHLVIVGGWSHRLHRLHELAGTPPYSPLMTLDADLAFSGRSPLTGDIREALRAANFREAFRGDHTPPVVYYRLGDEEDQGFYAEFLTPLYGGGVRRDGTPDATLRKAGIAAQKLRHVDLLLAEPWSVHLGAEAPVPLDPPVDLSIANPVSFIAQKLLIRSKRSADKQAQDALYIHDTLELFGSELVTLRDLWTGSLLQTLPPKLGRSVAQMAAKQFGAVDDVIRSAARIPADRNLRPDRLQQLCSFGLEAIFGRPR